MQKIAIIGAGCIGLSCAYSLKDRAKIDLFYSPKVSQASKIAAGLINPLAGMRANLANFGWEALDDAQKLIKHVETEADRTCIIHEGIFRPAVNETMQKRFQESEGVWCDPSKSQQFYPNPNNLPGIFIPKGFAIDAEAYIQALEDLCMQGGVRFIESHITDYKELQGYDQIIIAAGAGIKELVGDALGPLNLVKGQILNYTTDQHSTSALSGRGYLTIKKGILSVGATYEHFPKTSGPDIEEAMKIIKPKIDEYWPGLLESAPFSAQAGFRCTTPSSFPVFKEIDRRVFAIGGLGSKGFLYHAWIAKQLCKKIINTESTENTEISNFSL